MTGSHENGHPSASSCRYAECLCETDGSAMADINKAIAFTLRDAASSFGVSGV